MQRATKIICHHILDKGQESTGTKQSVITCRPSAVSNPNSCSSQSASRGRPSAHNSPLTVLTKAPFTLYKEMDTIALLFHLPKNTCNRRTHFCVHLPERLSNRERRGDATRSLYCPAIGQSDTEGDHCGFNPLFIVLFFPEGLKYSQSLSKSWTHLQPERKDKS